MRPTRKTTVLFLVMAALVATLAAANSTLEASSQAAKSSGKLTGVDGQVTVNGLGVAKGASILSGSTITTAARSSAVVSLGKLGRVEVRPSSTMKLTFSDDSGVAVGMLDQGRVRVSSSSGVNAAATTRDAQIAASDKQRNEFIVDTSCGNTFVSVRKGEVELRAGGTVKQIAAGNQDSAGQGQPGCTPEP